MTTAKDANLPTDGANAVQVGGSHYKGKAIQPWDYIVANDLGYLEGNVIKYVSRWKDKNGVQDLEKARHYLDKLIETVNLSPPAPQSGDPHREPDTPPLQKEPLMWVSHRASTDDML